MKLGENFKTLWLFAVEISLCVTISVIFCICPPRPRQLLFGETEIHERLIAPFVIQNTWTDFLSLKIKQGFNAYWSYCRHSDYLRPLSGDCINSSAL
jgi:hypothetical protein